MSDPRYPDAIVTDPVEIIDRRLKAVRDTQAAIKRLRDVFVYNWGPVRPDHDPMKLTLGEIWNYVEQRQWDLEMCYGLRVVINEDLPAPPLMPDWKDVRP